MLKKSKKPTGPKCTATASGGALKCALYGEHDTHSTEEPGRKSAQHATWSREPDGRIKVLTYQGRKKRGEWFEGTKIEGFTAAQVDAALTKIETMTIDTTNSDVVALAFVDPSPNTPDIAISKIRFDDGGSEQAMATGGDGVQGDPAPVVDDARLHGVDDMKQTAGGHLSDAKPERRRRSQYDHPGPLTKQQIAKLPPAASDSLRILGYRRHPAAALFPLLEGEAFARFADRVQASGLRDSIVLVEVGGEEFILDGSNRGLACEQRGVTARFVHYEGPKDMASLVAYSIDKNGEGRRHLDPSVRAMIALEAATLGRGNPGNRETGGAAGLTQAEAGKRLGVGERLVRKAKVVRDKGTAKVNEAVMAGKLTVEAAEHVTKLPAAKQDELADEALAKATPTKSGRVKALVKQEQKRDVVRKINNDQVPAKPVGPFRVIYVDWPWLYDNSDQHDGTRGHIPYPGMPVSDGIKLAGEVAELAHPDGCILGFWVTNAFVPDAVDMIRAWGFTWRTMYTWDKGRDGIGSWGRGRTEHLVIASRGECTHTLNEVSTLLEAPRREHSRKPDEAAEMFRVHCPGPHLEMFAREPRSGWQVWGAETNKFATEAA